MQRGTLLALAFFMVPAQAAIGQPAALNETQKLGQQLFAQHCGVCHLKPQITSQTFGPPLSKDSAGGNDEVMRGVIMNGTPRMPGFKLEFSPEQITAVIAYLRTVPPPPAPPAR